MDGPNNHLADIAVLKSGSVLPSLTAESGMLVQPARPATECEFDRFGEGPRHGKGSDLDPITWRQCYALSKLTFPLTNHSPCEWLWIEAWAAANFCRVFTSLNFAIAPSRRRNG